MERRIATRRIWIVLLLLAAAAVLARLAVMAQDLPGRVTAAHFDTLRQDLPRMRAFLQRMPKGGDLHTHLSGAVYAERLIAWAAADGLCLRAADMTLQNRPEGATAEQPCGTDGTLQPVATAIQGWRGQALFDLLVDALSMRWFIPTPAVPSGHDQFFATFAKFNPATGGSNWDTTLRRTAEMTADQLRIYEAGAVGYAEFMVTLFEGEDRRRMARIATEAAGDTPITQADPAVLLAALERAGLKQAAAARATQVAALASQVRELLGCSAKADNPGCGVHFRYIAQINRNAVPAEVFAQTALSAALVRAAPGLVAGLNYVGPEDYQTARRDYRTHMRWVGFLSGSDVPVALHAGELWLGLVPPPDLDFHIRDAVETAGARRIGHGTAIGFERDMTGLMEEMRRRGVAVEIALTSSDVILGVRGREHPLATYLRAGVPVSLATDDAGVSRIDLTNEYLRAARDHRLSYATLKRLAHAAIDHAFLTEAERKAELERLDRAFAAFEGEVSARLPVSAWASALLRAMLPSAGH